jgi:hypothetical protein
MKMVKMSTLHKQLPFRVSLRKLEKIIREIEEKHKVQLLIKEHGDNDDGNKRVPFWVNIDKLAKLDKQFEFLLDDEEILKMKQFDKMQDEIKELKNNINNIMQVLYLSNLLKRPKK